jgi:hypothetical protein
MAGHSCVQLRQQAVFSTVWYIMLDTPFMGSCSPTESLLGVCVFYTYLQNVKASVQVFDTLITII